MTVNARAILIRKKTLGADPLVDKVLEENSAEAILFAKAQRLFTHKLKKSYIESSLLASKELDKIATLLEIPLDIITMYRDVYYDVTDLDKLSKLDLINCDTAEERTLKMWSLSQGLDFISWRIGNQVSISPVEGLQDLFTTCIYKSKEAMFNGNTSEASKESTKYIKLAMDLARLIKVWVLDSAAAKHDIEIALRTVVPEFKGLDSLDAEMEKLEKAEKTAVKEVDPLGEISSFSISDLMESNNESE
jgi:hypothetical protein